MVQHWIREQRRAVRKVEQVEVDDQLFLRRIARETWRYFDDLVGPEHNWLPPDNSQEALRVEVADRTSPTNIGMWLMSAVSARDLGFLTPEQMVDRCAATMETLAKLETCEGHLLNWYNTRTLEPLLPKYVSTADSGNFIASLWVLKQASQELDAESQLDARALRGVADTLAVITERFPPDHSTAVPLAALRGLLEEESAGVEIPGRIRLAAEAARKLTDSLRWSVSPTGERAYWFTRLERQIEGWIQHADHYLRWLDVLAAAPDEFLQPLGEAPLRRAAICCATCLPGARWLAERQACSARSAGGRQQRGAVGEPHSVDCRAQGRVREGSGKVGGFARPIPAARRNVRCPRRPNKYAVLVRRSTASVCHRLPGGRPA